MGYEAQLDPRRPEGRGMSGFAVKGWCPDAWRPMMAGDGLLVRVKPRMGRLTREQVLGLGEAAMAHGSGLIDLTRRANLQIRGVGEDDRPALLEKLVALDLVDTDPVIESRRNLVIAPDWQAGDDTHRIASELLARLQELPELPGKVGFLVDAGAAPVLSGEAGDFRIERGEHGGLIVRAAGRAAGVAVTRGEEVDCLIALAHWFAASGGTDAGRMARHSADLPRWAGDDCLPARAAVRIVAGPHGLGMAYGAPFGRLEAPVLGELAGVPGLAAVRTTPWRLLLAEGVAQSERLPGTKLSIDPIDPLLRADACPGAPHCPQATVETRDLARLLAPSLAGRLHVSGCAKGCACPHPADVVLIGRDGLFDLALNASASSPPIRSGLSRCEILAYFGAA
jgi:precorrin-3B synthase